MTDAIDPLVECGLSEVALESHGCAKSSKFRGGVAAIVTVAVVTLFIGFRRASQTGERTDTNLSYDTIQKFDLSGMATTKCWKNRTFYVESNGDFKMPKTGNTRQVSAAACQAFCANTFGCEHFSYWQDGGCLLTSFSAHPKPYVGPEENGVISGPRECKLMDNGPSMVFEASALGLPAFRAQEAAGCDSLHEQYQLAWSAEGETFFDEWQFINKSETRGAEWYLNKSEAFFEGVVHASSAGAILRVGEQVQPFKRRSVMLHSAQAWRPDVGFIVAMKYKHVPYGPGIWPAFWMVNSDIRWPKGDAKFQSL